MLQLGADPNPEPKFWQNSEKYVYIFFFVVLVTLIVFFLGGGGFYITYTKYFSSGSRASSMEYKHIETVRI